MPSEVARGHPGSYSNFRLMDRRRLRLESRHRLHALASVGLFWNTTSGFGVSLCPFGSHCVTNQVHAVEALGNGMQPMASNSRRGPNFRPMTVYHRQRGAETLAY